MSIKLWDIYASLGVDMTQFNADMDAAIAKAQTLNSTLNNTPSPGGGSGRPTGGVSSSGSQDGGSGGSTAIPATGTDAAKVAIGNLMAEAVKKAASWGWEQTKESVELASAKQEVENITSVTFGDYSTALDIWAKGAKSQFGIGEVSAKQYAGLFGDMLSSAGLAGDELYTMSTELTELVGDIASFRNESFDEVFTRLYSGMVGETEAIRRYGVNMTVKNMEDYSGLEWEKASADAQYRARYDYIMSHTTGAQGDFLRTLDESAANQKRLFDENIKETKIKWGEKFLPTVTSVIHGLNDTIFTSEQTLTEKMAAYDAASATARANAEKTEGEVSALLAIMEEIEAKGENNTNNPLWTQSLARLSTLMPGLSNQIDLTAGTMGITMDDVRTQTEAWKRDAITAAASAAEIGKLDLLDAAENELANKQIDLSLEQSRFASAEKTILENAQKMADALWGNSAGATSVAYQFTSNPTIAGAEAMLDMYENKRGLYRLYGTDLADDEQIFYETLTSAFSDYKVSKISIDTLGGEISTLETQIDSGKESLNTYNEIMDSAIDTTTETVDSMDQSGAAFNAGYATGVAYAEGMRSGLSTVPNPADYIPGLGASADGNTSAAGVGYEASEKSDTGSNVYSDIVSAVRDGMSGISVNMDKVTVGHMVSDTVSQDIAKTAKSKRYTT